MVFYFDDCGYLAYRAKILLKSSMIKMKHFKKIKSKTKNTPKY